MRHKSIRALSLILLIALSACGHYERHVHHLYVVDKLYRPDTRETDMGWSFGKHGGPVVVSSGSREAFFLLVREPNVDTHSLEVTADTYGTAKSGQTVDIALDDWVADK